MVKNTTRPQSDFAEAGDWLCGQRPGLGWAAAVFCVLAQMLIGCSDGRSSVSGSVTLDGQPLVRTQNRQITVMFRPESGSGVPASALVDESGEFTLSTGAQSGLAPGKYIVVVAATESTPAANGGVPSKRALTPLKYAKPTETDLRADVQPGRNTFSFDLKSSPAT